jgi:outer membrane murein-binding lipoprotein Lpp
MSEPTITEPVSTPAFPPPPPPSKSRKTWTRRKAIVIIVAVAIVCLAIGGASSKNTANKAEDKADQRSADVAFLEDSLTAAEEERDEAREQAVAAEDEAVVVAEETLATGQAELDTRSADLDERQASLDQAEADVAAREEAVGVAEAAREANSFTDGIYAVGTDIQPGQYHTDGASGMCYYASLGADGQDIIDNNIVDGGGPATTIIDSPFFESSGCGTWTKVG